MVRPFAAKEIDQNEVLALQRQNEEAIQNKDFMGLPEALLPEISQPNLERITIEKLGG